MRHSETYAVTEENGPCPAGRPDRCFYCDAPLGGDHNPGCVCRTKTIVMRYSFDVMIRAPEDWEAHNAEFNRNESGWCATNAISEIEHYKGPRLCNIFSAQFVREATAGDEEKWRGEDELDEPKCCEEWRGQYIYRASEEGPLMLGAPLYLSSKPTLCPECGREL